MDLIDLLRRGPHPLKVDHNYLLTNLGNLNKRDQGGLGDKIRKRQDEIKDLYAEVAKVPQANSIADLVKKDEIRIYGPYGYQGKPKHTKTSGNQVPSQVRTFLAVLLMFEKVDPAKPIFEEYILNQPDANYPSLSDAFVRKHITQDNTQAEKVARERYVANNDILVSTFLLPDVGRDFNSEVQACTESAFFDLLLGRFQRKEGSYRERNKRIADLVIRSAKKYTKVNCTEANQFAPNTFEDYLYYGLAQPRALGGSARVICDHYVRRGQVFKEGENTLLPGWKELEYTKINPAQNAKQAGDAIWPRLQKEGDHVRVYVKYGTF